MDTTLCATLVTVSLSTLLLEVSPWSWVPPSPSSLLHVLVSLFALPLPLIPVTNGFFRTPCVYHSVHYWCHCWCWPLLWYLALYQLAHGCLDLHGMDHYSSRRWCHLRCHLWYHHQRPSLGLLWLESRSLCLIEIYIHSLKLPSWVCYNIRMDTEPRPGYLYRVRQAEGT